MLLQKFSKNIKYLYFNRILLNAAFGLISGFSVLFFYESFGMIIFWVLILDAFTNLSFGIFSHFSAKFIKKIGMTKMMVFAISSLSVSFLSLALWHINPIVSLILYFITLTIYKSFYWVPFHIEFAKFIDHKKSGSQMAFLYNLSDFILAFLPFLAGFLIGLYGYSIVFMIGVGLILLSIIPLFKVEEVKEEYVWNAKQLFREIVKKKNRPIVLSNIGNGMQSVVAHVIWPIFVFIIVGQNYLNFGLIITAISAVLFC